MKKLLPVLLAALFCLPLGAQQQDSLYTDPVFGDHIDRSVENFVTASLVIAEPTNWTDDFFGVFGHAFIRLQCPAFDLDYCYSYESERVNGQLLNYLRGKLKMGMFSIPTDEYLEDYRKWNRAVHEYQLNLPPEVEQRLWEIMDNHVLEGADLVMDLGKRGCASSAAEYILEALKPMRPTYLSKPRKRDFRVPARLSALWMNARFEGKPFIEYKGDLVEARKATFFDIWFDKTAFAVFVAFISILLGALLLFKNNR